MKKDINIFKIMTPIEKVAFVRTNCSLRQSLEKMRAHRYSVLPVLYEDGTYAGSISEGDFLWFTLEHNEIKNIEECEKYKVEEIIKPAFYPPMHVNVTFDNLITQIKNQNYVPLVDDRGYLIGIVTRTDIVKVLYE